jgi:hypothetical protein
MIKKKNRLLFYLLDEFSTTRVIAARIAVCVVQAGLSVLR